MCSRNFPDLRALGNERDQAQLPATHRTAPDAATLTTAVAARDSEIGIAQGTFLGRLAESANNQLQVGLVGLATTGIDLGPPVF